MGFNEYIFFSISAILILAVILIVYFSKKRLNLIENNIYISMVILTIIGVIFELVLVFGGINLIQHQFLLSLFGKGFLLIVETWVVLLSAYTMIVTSVHNEQQNFKTKLVLLLIPLLIIYVFTILLDIEYVYNDSYTSILYSIGPATKVVLFSGIIYIAICLFCIIKYLLKIKKYDNRFIPVFVYIVLSIVVSFLQQVEPSIILLSYTESIILLIMYFTIENPDIKMLEQVEIERDRADKANQAKSDFLSSMSHEIRTPLNAITGFSEMIMSSETLEEAQENAKDIISASGTLLETVNGILDISKIESGKIELVEGDYNPYKMIDETVKLARGRLGDKPLDFQVNIAQDIPKVLYGDKFNIKKILINFLTNAIKYTDEGFVRFDVQCVKLNGMVRLIFIVSDSGRGIKKEDISKLFTKFQRLDEEKNQTIEGTGLGLAITKQLIEMMKGTVVVDSVYGEGSKFTFALDQKISDATLDETTQQMDVVVDLSGKKILVVDDNKLNLKVADKLLKLYNVSVTLSNSGEDCISLINDGNKFDLIMLDDMMPKMSGTETLKHLKDIHEFNTPVVALTANAINGMKEKYLEAGFDGYLAKPIVKDELYRTLVRFLNPVASYEADKDSKVIPTEEVKEEVKEEPIEVKEEVNEVPKVDPQNDIVPRISKVGDIPKYVPDNIEIVVKPGDKQIKEETTEEVKEEPKNDNSDTVILIVDDNNLNIKVETKLITSLGYKVESANSGIEAINKVKSKQYNLIFMDIMMPMMDGVKTLHELQKLQGFNTPVVALTADAVLGAKEKYLAEGFNLYVTKPANKEDFNEIIKKYIS